MARRRGAISPDQLALFGQQVGGSSPTGPSSGASLGVRRGPNKLSVAKVFTEEQESRPGPWEPFSSSRVVQGRYDYGTRHIDVVFRDGTPWTYEDVPLGVWHQFKRSASPGRFINRRLNSYPYRRGDFDVS